MTVCVAAGIAAEGHAVLNLPSKADHDGMAIAAIAPIATSFVRGRGGIRNDATEFASLDDFEAGARGMARVLHGLATQARPCPSMANVREAFGSCGRPPAP